MKSHNTRMALITGASSGIGAAFARQLASNGYDLILIARRKERLVSLASELEQRFHIKAAVLIADLSNPIDIERIEMKLTELQALDILINNAGFGIPGKFAEIQRDRHLTMIQVHILASVRLSRAALPGMVARGQGAIINISSIGAFFPKPGDVTYCATKAYLNTFSVTLQAELKGTGVQIQALCPGFTYTEFYDHTEYEGLEIKARIPKALWMSTEDVVAESLKALKQDRVICIPGFKNRLIVALNRFGLMTPLLNVLSIFLKNSGIHDK